MTLRENCRVVRLMGGLGNQMFQYAFGCFLAGESKANVKFDVESGFAHDRYCRSFALDAFNTSITPAIAKEIPLGMSWASPWHRLAKLGWSRLPQRQPRVVYERERFSFDPEILHLGGNNSYYFGYWQSSGYCVPVREQLLKEFSLTRPSSPSVLALRKEMEQCRSISVHVRLYLDKGADGKVISSTRVHHRPCGAEYYEHGVNRIGLEPGTVYYVFSDHPDIAKKTIRLPPPVRYVADRCQCSAAEEMMLMAACQHHVISNSSFSWWGAWLGRNSRKQVVAPKNWGIRQPQDEVNIYPPGWIRL